jgi:hypothetical protein
MLSTTCGGHEKVCPLLLNDVEQLPPVPQRHVLWSLRACDASCRSALASRVLAIEVPASLRSIIVEECRRDSTGCRELAQRWDPRTDGAAVLSAVLDGERRACTRKETFACAAIESTLRTNPPALTSEERARTNAWLKQHR